MVMESWLAETRQDRTRAPRPAQQDGRGRDQELKFSVAVQVVVASCWCCVRRSTLCRRCPHLSYQGAAKALASCTPPAHLPTAWTLSGGKLSGTIALRSGSSTVLTVHGRGVCSCVASQASQATPAPARTVGSAPSVCPALALLCNTASVDGDRIAKSHREIF